MFNSLKLETKSPELLESLQNFFRSILELDEISAILAPKLLPMKNMVMPVLISSPEQLQNCIQAYAQTHWRQDSSRFTPL